MDQWPQVESCLECSAKTLQFVQDVFFYAVKVGPSPDLSLNSSAWHGMHPAALSCTLRPSSCTLKPVSCWLPTQAMRCLTRCLLCCPLQAVLHPQAPLMDIAQGRLQPLCIKALKRVFIMSDKNQVSQLVNLRPGLGVWPVLLCGMAVCPVTCCICGTASVRD